MSTNFSSTTSYVSTVSTTTEAETVTKSTTLRMPLNFIRPQLPTTTTITTTTTTTTTLNQANLTTKDWIMNITQDISLDRSCDYSWIDRLTGKRIGFQIKMYFNSKAGGESLGRP